ncbi:hypothetical protein [Peribacillus kribbensis]|nr:hypothetical protein [Peribacillus kribbensis]
MLEKEEYSILFRELEWLIYEYRSCHREAVKKEIFSDIKLLTEAITIE